MANKAVGSVKARETAPPAGGLELSCWLVYWDGGASWADFEKHAPLFARVCPQWYHCNALGWPERGPDAGHLQRMATVALSHRHGVKVLAMVNNFGGTDFDAKRLDRFLAEPARRLAHAQELVRLALEDGADGLDVDYENLRSEQREDFSLFMEALAALCRRKGLLLGTAVHPKTSEAEASAAALAQDYQRLGQAVDFFRPMTYDLHWSTSEPGPIAPLAWVEKALAFACEQVPASKVELGVPGYGYDWPAPPRPGQSGVPARPLGWRAWNDLLQKHGPARRDKGGELVLRYEGRTAFFVDAEALAPKFDLAARLGARGLALWIPGSVDPAFWEAARERMAGSAPPAGSPEAVSASSRPSRRGGSQAG